MEGDEESFNLALADTLEAHRAYFDVADRADDPNVSVNLDALALACHACRRGWAIYVNSPYLPQELLQAADPFCVGVSDEHGWLGRHLRPRDCKGG
ncbi:immunity 49 family protein [Streptomyces sp. NPDC056007]|uniref:immunity 49 family protein n=1 Tax=Streptomyces sp. NPDC056007 TaxID=3345678 RepID=UPI0035D888D2